MTDHPSSCYCWTTHDIVHHAHACTLQVHCK